MILVGGLAPKLQQAVDSLSPERREAFLQHLEGGTSADYLADWLRRAGHPVSATTIKISRSHLRGVAA